MTHRAVRTTRLARLLAFVVVAATTRGAPAQPLPKDLGWEAKVHPSLLAAPPETEQELLVVLDETADLSRAAALATKEEKTRFVFEQLTETARRSQGPLLADLAERGLSAQSFWIANVVFVRGRADLVEALARRPDVRRVEPNPRIPLRSPVPNREPAPAGASPDAAEAVASGPEWNVTKIGAPAVWAAGFRGQGVVVAGADTGYDWTHPALKGKYRGWNGSTANHNYNWHDAIHNAQPGNPCKSDAKAPCDDDSHGTHTMGIMVGDDGAGNQIGVAPGARWIGCRNMDEGTGTPARYIECFQFFLAPTDLSGANPNPSLAPDVINNSWDCPPSEGCTNPDTLKSIIESVRAAGIVVAVAGGNEGPACNSMDVPERYDASFTVGATNSSDTVESYSSRGPGESDLPKPQFCAPGSNIRSSIPGGGYAVMSGTSMASPHAAGTAALLLSAAPGLSGNVTALEVLLEQTAVAKTTTDTCGGIPAGAIPNDTAGFGRIDAFAGYNAVVSANAPPTVSISSPATGANFTAPASISITVSVADSNGKVARVDLYAGTTRLKTLLAPPWSWTWSGVGVGTYSLTAVATDNQGASTTSAPVSITINVSTSLPGPWVERDIGSVGVAGSSAFVNGSYTVKGSGADVWSTADAFHFVYQPLAGDGEIVARVASIQNTSVWAKAGVMIRETTAANSTYAYMLVSPTSGVAFQRRLTSGAGAVGTTVTGIAAPVWVRLQRSGNVFTAYRSADGVTWTVVGSATISMAASVLVGLAVTSHNNGVSCAAVFDHVFATTPWTSADIGAVGVAGSTTIAAGSVTVQGSGSDVWSSSDAFRYVYQTLAGDGEIVARVASIQNTSVWAKAGVMVRETTAANSRYAFMLVSPTSGVAFQRRITTGGSAVGNTVIGIAAPVWVRLKRSGTLFTAYESADGETWTSVGSTTISMNTNVLVGLAVTSHNNTVTCTATFDNVARP